MSALNAQSQPVSLSEERGAHEPSMEEILASIRRIIADDEHPQLGRKSPALPPRAPLESAGEEPDARYRHAVAPLQAEEDHRLGLRRERSERAYDDEMAQHERRRPFPEASETAPRAAPRDAGGASDRLRSPAVAEEGGEAASGRERIERAKAAEFAQRPLARETNVASEGRDRFRPASTVGAAPAASEVAGGYYASAPARREESRLHEGEDADRSERRRALSESSETHAPEMERDDEAAPVSDGSEASFDASSREEAHDDDSGAPHEQGYAADHAHLTEMEAGPLMSSDAAASITAHFQQLAATMLINDSGLLQEYAREMLRPMLKAWLDDNLPVLVERLVRAEIERVARGGRR